MPGEFHLHMHSQQPSVRGLQVGDGMRGGRRVCGCHSFAYHFFVEKNAVFSRILAKIGVTPKTAALTTTHPIPLFEALWL